MKGNKINIKAKGKPKSKTEKNLDYIKRVRGIDRELAKDSGEFHTWMPQSRVHTDKKKKANKKECRNFKHSKDKE